MLNLAEELLLLSIDDQKGTVISCDQVLDYGLAGSVLVELILQQKVEITDNLVIVTDVTSTGDQILDAAIAKIQQATQPVLAQRWIDSLSSDLGGLRQILLDQLVVKGILRKDEQKILWMFSVANYPTQDVAVENEVRRRVRAAVMTGNFDSSRTLVLVAILSTCRFVLNSIFKPEEQAQVNIRVKEMLDADFTGKAIAEVVRCMDNSTMAAFGAAIAPIA
jgi:golgi phosphoprotein 3